MRDSFVSFKIFTMERTDNLTYTEKLLQKRTEAVINEEEFDKAFKPKGAIAFFVLLVILGAIIWYGIYFLMIQRG